MSSGWMKSDHEGRVCYERGGERVYSTEAIDAIDGVSGTVRSYSYHVRLGNKLIIALIAGVSAFIGFAVGIMV